MGNVNGIAANQRRKAAMSMSAEDCLWAAVASGDADAAALQQAIRDGANVNAVRRDTFTGGFYNDCTPLMKACGYRGGFDQIIHILLKAGADAWWRNDLGESAISIACYEGHFSTVQLLINHDKGLLEVADKRGQTPLNVAIRARHSDIARFLLDSGADPHHVDQYGVTTLMHACEERSLEIVQLLLAAGADAEATDKYQRTALHHAAVYSRVEVVRELILQHNANMFVVDEDGRTPFDVACVWLKSNADIDRLLEIYGNRLTQDQGRLALHELLKVAEYSFAEERRFHPPRNPLQIILPLGKLTLKHLRALLHTLDPELIHTRDDTGKLPMHIACQTNAPVEVLALILELDTAVLHIADFAGALPIHLLCVSTAAPEYASVRYLIQSYPRSVAVQTNAGDYPFMVAASDSSWPSLSVIYELVRANPGLVVPR